MTEAEFTGGGNLAMKMPAHLYEACVTFYGDAIGLPVLQSGDRHTCFQFGAMKLWLDKRDDLSQAEIWLELYTGDTKTAALRLDQPGVQRRDEIEPLPDDFDGFWIANPAGIIHLVTTEHD